MAKFSEAFQAGSTKARGTAPSEAPPPSPSRSGSRALSDDALCALASTCTYDARKFANALNVSLRQLQREFRRQFCCTPQAWLQAKRLEAARVMLSEAESVKAVAYTLGFRQLSQFSRDFKRHFGITPSEVRSRI